MPDQGHISQAHKTKIAYETAVYDVVVGQFHFQIEALADFERTVDQHFSAVDFPNEAELHPDHCPYFADLWPAARALATDLAGLTWGEEQIPRVLELGCGLALPSFVATRLGFDVTASDCHPDAPGFLRRNTQRNQIQSLKYIDLDWRIERDPMLGVFDLIYGSDILYDRDQPARLLAQILTLGRRGTRVIIADPGRAYLQEFSDLLQQNGFLTSTRVVSVPAFGKHLAADIFILDSLFK